MTRVTWESAWPPAQSQNCITAGWCSRDLESRWTRRRLLNLVRVTLPSISRPQITDKSLQNKVGNYEMYGGLWILRQHSGNYSSVYLFIYLCIYAQYFSKNAHLKLFKILASNNSDTHNLEFYILQTLKHMQSTKLWKKANIASSTYNVPATSTNTKFAWPNKKQPLLAASNSFLVHF